MSRPPPVYSEDPDDPFLNVDPDDPNLSFTTPPHPSELRLPEGASPNQTVYVLSGAPAVGMSLSWLITRALTHRISGAVYASYNSWDKALAAYTSAYNANAIEILRDRRASPVRHRAVNPPSQGTPGGSYSNPYVIASSAPTTPQRPSIQYGMPSATPGAASSPSTPFPSGHPQHPFYIGSSPAPVSPAPSYHTAAPSQTAASASRLRLIEEALSDGGLRTPSPAHDTYTADSVRARIQALEEALSEYQIREETGSSPQTPTQANNNIEARLATLEAAMDYLLTREAERMSLQLGQCGGDGRDATPSDSAHLDGRDATPSDLAHPFLDGRDPSAPRSAASPLPAAGSSTGPGTIAGQAARASASPSNLRSPFALADLNVCDDPDNALYDFEDYSPEEYARVEELLNVIHDNYLANKKN